MAARSQKKALGVLFLVVATELIGFGLIIPVLPQIAYRFETSHWQLGILLAAYSAAQFLASPLLGSLSDRFGRKPLLIISKIGTVLSYIIFAYAQSYSLILLSRLLDGFTGGNISVARAYIVDVTTKKTRAKGMALLGIAFGLGFVIGPGLGGLLYQHSHVIPALVAGGLSFVALILTIWLLDEPQKHTKTVSQHRKIFSFFTHLKTPIISFIFFVHCIRMIVFSGFETTFSLFTFQEFGFLEKQNSLFFFYLGITGLIIQGSLSRWHMKKIPRLIIIGLLTLGGAQFLLAYATTVWGLVAALLVLEVGISLVMIYLPTWLAENNTDETSTGALMGLYESFGSLARIIGPLIAYLTIFSDIRLGYHYFGYVMLALCACFLWPRLWRSTG